MSDFDLNAKRAEQAAAREAALGRVVDLDTSMPDDETAHLDPAAIAACKRCDADGYTPTKRICDHKDHAAAAAKHMPEIRDILQKGPQR